MGTLYKDPASNIDNYLSYVSGGTYNCIKQCNVDIIIVTGANYPTISSEIYCDKNGVRILMASARNTNSSNKTSISIVEGDKLKISCSTNSNGGTFLFAFIVY